MEEGRKYPIILVTWADTHMSQGGWLDLSEYEDDGECIVSSVGFHVPVGEPGSKDKHVTLWQSFSKDEAIHAVHIPVGMVRELKILQDNT